MKETTLCYITRAAENADGREILMLYRNKKPNDPNGGKWIGLGGKLEEGETPEVCLLREIKEEVGLTLTAYRYRGAVDFFSDLWEPERMHLFTADGFDGEVTDCDEGEPRWVSVEEFDSLPQWEGDKIFLRLMREEAPFFELTLRYRGEKLEEAVLNGKSLPLSTTD